MLPPLAEERFTPLHWHRCRRQGIIFELAYKLEYDMKDFVKIYMLSKFVRFELDRWSSPYQDVEPIVCLRQVLAEKEPKHVKQKENQSLYWHLGYTYRYICFRQGYPSALLYRILRKTKTGENFY